MGEQKPARRHHYLPESYLAGFTPSGTKADFLYVFDHDAPDHVPRRQRPRQVACRKDFHRLDWPGLPPDFVEKGVYARFEADVAPVIKRVGGHGDLSRRDLDLLLQFAALSAVRVPSKREGFRLALEQITGTSFESAVTKPKAWELILKWNAHENVGWGEEELQALIESPALSEARPQLWDFLNTVMTQDTWLKQLEKRRWSLWLAPEEGPNFICSDDPFSLEHALPVLPYRTPAVNDAGTVVTFPVSRDAALVGRLDGEDGIGEVDTRGVALINRDTIGSADRFLYSPTDDFVWLGEAGGISDWASLVDLRERCNRGEIPSSIPPEYFEGLCDPPAQPET